MASNTQGMLSAEDVAYWYLRLNGFLLLENFIVHGDRSNDQRTEIDLLGVRFRYRQEHLAQPMKDDDRIISEDRTVVVFCDAKKGPQDFNKTWWTDERKVMESFLALVGVVPSDRWKHVARALYADGFAKLSGDLLVTTLLIHEDKQGIVQPHWPAAPRVQITQALRFIHRRFYDYHNPKTPHVQWNPAGHRLWDLYYQCRNSPEKFVSMVASELGAVVT
jgi:hypothetical protein